MQTEAIVNTTKSFLYATKEPNDKINKLSRLTLRSASKVLNNCRVGEVKKTSCVSIYANCIFNVVEPIWEGGNNGEKEKLKSCYFNCLNLAKNRNISSIAFPLISADASNYPKKEALDVAISSIRCFLNNNDTDMMIYLVVNKGLITLDEKLNRSLQYFIDNFYNGKHTEFLSPSRKTYQGGFISAEGNQNIKHSTVKNSAGSKNSVNIRYSLEVAPLREKYDKVIKNMFDESFTDMLLRKIDESGMKHSECYKKANIDKTLFSKIKADKYYRPSKTTALAFAIALEMDIDETKDLLRKAGYALSHSNIFDIIIEYFIKKGNYDIFEINEVLFVYNQTTLGSK